jgi:alpha-N-arabinofuranosidase
MQYNNPVIRGYYADPSICRANGKYYLVASSCQYFPGVPLFESDELINWRQIGSCLTRKSQLRLDGVGSSGGIYAPTIRYNDGRFYMVTTNMSPKSSAEGGGNFYVWTDDIYSEWSEPVFVDQGGIDPSLYFENGKTYFMSNGVDDKGVNVIFQCEIDIKTGKKLSESKALWHGTGGRYLEAPHLYCINGLYYLMVAEGGTEFGHMVTYARSDNLYGPFTPYAHNPVLTNRNLGGYQLQGIGHGDLIDDEDGNWWMVTLGFRQIHQWLQYHHLGREICLTPVTFNKDCWFTAGDGTTSLVTETDRISPSVMQKFKSSYTFENTPWASEWVFLRSYDADNYKLGTNSLGIRSSNDTIDTVGSPAFIGLRQKEFDMELSLRVKVLSGEAGICIYMDQNHHYDLFLINEGNSCNIKLKLNIGDIKHQRSVVPVTHNEIVFKIRSNAINYEFFYCDSKKNEISLGTAQSRYLSSEVTGGFTGVIIGMYSQGGEKDLYNEFTDFSCNYKI